MRGKNSRAPVSPAVILLKIKKGEIVMFCVAEKKKIAEEIEKLLLNLNHPEMPKEKPTFRLHVDGKESWSWADIEPNWKLKKEVNTYGYLLG